MAYEYITKYDSPNYNSGRQGNKVKYIVIHHWGKDGQSFSGVVNWLCRANGSSSAHYVVEHGKVACIVSSTDTAWHAGNWTYNLESVGLECRPEMTQGDLETTAELIAELWKSFGKLQIIGHKDIVATACPGRYYNKLGYLRELAESYYNGTTYSGWIKDDVGWWYKNLDGSYPKSTWLKLEEDWYYFNDKGYAVSGWQYYKDKWYYLNADCKMQTGWQLINNKWYYFNANGDMTEGWKEYKGKWYYLKPSNGDMISDEFRQINGTWYKFNEDGNMVKNVTLDIADDGKITILDKRA